MQVSSKVSVSQPVKLQATVGIGRFRKYAAVLGTTGKGKNPVVIISQRAWDYKKCRQRIVSNPRDGDARYIVVAYLYLKNDFKKALSHAEADSIYDFTYFSLYDLKILMGNILYELGKEARKEKNPDKYYLSIQREQSLYKPLLSAPVSNQVHDDFTFLYAQTIADIGIYFEENEKKNQKNTPFSHESETITGSRDAFNRALALADTSFEKTSRRLYEFRAFLYEKLGNTKAALSEKKILGKMVKDSLYARQRGQIIGMLLREFAGKPLLTDSVARQCFLWIQRGLYSNEYLFENRTMLDTLSNAYVNAATVHISKKYGKLIAPLSVENRKLLLMDLRSAMREKIADTISTMETSAAVAKIQDLLSEKNTSRAAILIAKYGALIATRVDVNEYVACVTELHMVQKDIQRERERQQKEREELGRRERAQQETVEASSGKSRETEGMRKRDAPGSRKSDTVKAGIHDISGVPAHVRVNTLIEQLISRKDYIAAYRGIRVYEKMLRENYPPKLIDTRIGELETTIGKEYGDKYLSDLKGEYQK